MNGDILRFVDAIHRDKSIDKSIIFKGIETALEKAAQKQLDSDEEVDISIDQETGDISATRNGNRLDPEMLGRIGAQTARQVMIQKIREAESESLYEDFKEKEGEIVSGSVSRFSGPNMLVTIGQVEAFFPKSQQVPGESYQVGDRLRALVKDVGKKGSKIMVELSRTHPDFIRRLFELEVPEIQEDIIEIKNISSEPGNRTKVAVASKEEDVDAVGACVGVRGSRIKGIVAELNDERVDIIEWHPEEAQMIENSLKPAEVREVKLFEEDNLARVTVDEDQLSIAIGKGGQNVRLASKLTGWEIDVMSAEEEQELLKEEQRLAEDTSPGEPAADETEADGGDDEPAEDAEGEEIPDEEEDPEADTEPDEEEDRADADEDEEDTTGAEADEASDEETADEEEDDLDATEPPPEEVTEAEEEDVETEVLDAEDVGTEELEAEENEEAEETETDGSDSVEQAEEASGDPVPDDDEDATEPERRPDEEPEDVDSDSDTDPLET